MIEFGKTLREAREAKGLTINQIAETTHLLSQIVEDMENEDFHRISAPIYGRGFVKLYCEAVGIEPKPLVDEFMAILNGERQPAIRMKAVELPPEEEVKVEQPPAPPVYTQPELGESEDEGVRQETRDASLGQGVRPETQDTSERLETADFVSNNQTIKQSNDVSAVPPPTHRYHPDYAKAAPPFTLSPNFGRLTILAGGILAIIALLVWGGRALYRASMGESATPAAPQEVKVEGEKKAKPAEATQDKRQEARDASGDKKTADKKTGDKKTTSARQPKEVPALYID